MFQQKPEDRLRSWRDFRTAIGDLPLDHALAQTAEFWAGAPFVPYNLDPDIPTLWPDPWTLVNENVYCDVAKCLGIVYTLLLSKHRMDIDIELRMYQDLENKYVYNLAWINQGKYIINMIDREVLNIEQFDKTLQLKKTYTAVDLQLDNY
jgi:hypothetical protein